MADDAWAEHAIHDAFRQRGFERDWKHRGRRYVGVLDPADAKVAVTMDVCDLDFVHAPRICLAGELPAGRQIPHIQGSHRSLCYYESGAVVLDRYDPGGTVMQCLAQAERVLRDGMKGRLVTDFADEFLAYWSADTVAVDLPADFEGEATVSFPRVTRHEGPSALLFRNPSWLRKLYDPSASNDEPCVVVRIQQALSVDPNQKWPADSLPRFNEWLRWVEPSLVGLMEAAFLKSTSPAQWIGIAATNGLFLARIQLPPAFRREEFIKNRRQRIAGTLGRIAPTMTVKRFGGQRADERYIFGRNMGDEVNLAGKRILLLGCGTIGGFLAQQLCQVGAGSAGGRLTLCDKDTLTTANLGRHLLGAPYLDRNKATACAEFLKSQLPMLDVVAQPDDVLPSRVRLERFDLVIDATGEEAFSLALNEAGVRLGQSCPAMLFVWLVGNGAAAQCLLVPTADAACLKCLKPDLAGEPRYRTLRKGTDIVTERNLSCGDALYMPFPVSRSVAAASLACEAALDWTRGTCEPHFRSQTLDRRRAYLVKDATPSKSRACPACGTTRR